MRKLILFFLISSLCVLLSACASTGSTIYTYDSEGRVTQKTVTSESVVKTITDSTRGKTVIAWDNSWLAGLSISTATTEDPTPTIKILAGRNDKGVINLLPEHNISALIEVIPAIRAGDLTLGISGVTATKQEGEK